MITASVVVKSKAVATTRNVNIKGGDDEERTEWLPAEQIFTPSEISEDSFLTFYQSSENRRRSFCGRCGTSVSYAALPMPEGWPDMLDIVMGTVDRGDLEGEALRPERMLWWDYGVGWIKDLSMKGMGEVPRHGNHMVNEVVKSDG